MGLKSQKTDELIPESSQPSGKAASTSSKGPGDTQSSSQEEQTEPPAPGDEARRGNPRLSGGTWRGKAAAIAEIARESISANNTPEASPNRGAQQKSMRRPRLSQGLSTPSKSSPSAASMTKFHVTSNNSEGRSSEDTKASSSQQEQAQADKPFAPQEKDGAAENTGAAESQERLAPAPYWRGWWSRPRTIDLEKSGEPTSNPPKAMDETCSTQGTETLANPNEQISTQQPSHDKVHPQAADEPSAQIRSESKTPSRSSWFGLWGSGHPPTNSDAVVESAPKSESAEPSHSPVDAVPETVRVLTGASDYQNQKKSQVRPSSGSWVFWSRERTRAGNASKSEPSTSGEVGEIAIQRTASESKPQPVEIKEVEEDITKLKDPMSKKRERPISSEQGQQASKKRTAQSNQDSGTSEATSMQDSILKTTVHPSRKTSIQKPKAAEGSSKGPANLLLPAFRDTYTVASSPSCWQSISRMIVGGQDTSRKHLSLSSTQPRVQRALAIGVHGYFPAPLIQKVLGAPTGTSIRFADGAAEAIDRYASTHGLKCTIEKAALEGEGMVNDRVENLWKLLLNWIDQIRKADLILIACHSQGVPVAVSLVARLLGFGCISSSARIGICAMAGINLGPFSSYQSQSRFFGGSAAELFDFSRPNTTVSDNYATALRMLLKQHVRIVYVGSIDDQLVSMESATFANISHPYIYRAVFVDSRIHAPDFLTHLVGFALKLRNQGVSEHGLVRELSGPLAGSLYTGEGHSRIYEDQAVYELAVEHALETATLDAGHNPDMEMHPYESSGATGANPYFLPWAMRGVLEEEYVRKELKGETEKLLSMFDKWRPQSKVLKDVKFRLEAVKSKL